MRPYQPDDLSGLLICWEAAIRSSPPALPDAFLVEERDNVAGYMERLDVTVTHDLSGFIATKGGYVAGLFVHPQAQGRGVGARLLRTQNASCLDVFEANLPARKFYAAQGFRAVGQRNHPETGFSMICLLKRH